MELGKQIKKYRKEKAFSQDVLAEKVYVSRQTISNWENDKSYPDVKSLVLLSEVFEVSLDRLIKGDVEKMKEQINKEDQKRFERLSVIFGVLLLATLITPVPLEHYLSRVGIGIWLGIFAAGMYEILCKLRRDYRSFTLYLSNLQTGSSYSLHHFIEEN